MILRLDDLCERMPLRVVVLRLDQRVVRIMHQANAIGRTRPSDFCSDHAAPISHLGFANGH